MIELIEEKFHIKTPPAIKKEYRSCIEDLAQNDLIHSLHDFAHHSNISRLEHCLHVSYTSYLLCRKLGLNSRSAARGGLLHDFFLYDSRLTKPDRGLHCLRHPAIALANARNLFLLNEIEEDIIVKHMWPVTIRLPRYKESYVVTLADKYCAYKEIAWYSHIASQ